MVKKICLDSDVCIAILRNESRAQQIKDLIVDAEICVSTVTIFELFLRRTNLDVVDEFIGKIDRLSLNEHAARYASSLYKTLEQNGTPIELRDLFIAATCIAHDCFFLTFNVKHFERVHGLKLIRI
ncbi:type II toxin-antitoxin system VapC family toxin [Candidatus Woesearchaeota archaeon]|nr:type II toxin-antitoxin system VapC family toxin [Candidatus Woesearchaeota archaeon]